MTADDIKALRRELDLTARKLAERLGVEERVVFGWESGELFPTKRNCDDLARLKEGMPAPQPSSRRVSSPFASLADPDLWAIIRKLTASRELFEQVRALAAKYPDPAAE